MSDSYFTPQKPRRQSQHDHIQQYRECPTPVMSEVALRTDSISVEVREQRAIKKLQQVLSVEHETPTQ